jgi:hypothetical protein
MLQQVAELESASLGFDGDNPFASLDTVDWTDHDPFALEGQNNSTEATIANSFLNMWTTV